MISSENPVFLMSKAEKLVYANELQEKFELAIIDFLRNSPPPEHAVKIKREKVAAWHIGYTGFDDTDGPCGWPMTLDAKGNLYKGPFRRPSTKFTIDQVERAIEILANKLRTVRKSQ